MYAAAQFAHYAKHLKFEKMYLHVAGRTGKPTSLAGGRSYEPYAVVERPKERFNTPAPEERYETVYRVVMEPLKPNAFCWEQQ